MLTFGRIVPILAVLLCALLILCRPSPALATHELPAGCVQTPLPSFVGTPTFSFDVAHRTFPRYGLPLPGLATLHLEVWRAACLGDPAFAALLLKATPTSELPYVPDVPCSSDFIVIQDGIEFAVGVYDTFRVGIRWVPLLEYPVSSSCLGHGRSIWGKRGMLLISI